MTTLLKKTTAVARELAIPTYLLHNWVRYGLLQVPAKDTSNHMIWSPADVEAARRLRDERQPASRPLKVT